MSIHPTAIIEEGVQFGANCSVAAFAVIKRGTVLGDGVKVYESAVVGGDPQYLKFDPATVSGVRIGAGTVIREHVTINRAIHTGNATIVGARGFIMAGVHLGHDCILGDDVVLANNVLLAGHVEVGNHCFLGGGAAFHQFVRLGEGAMISGLSRITRDVAPFLLAAERDEVPGLNLVGLKRRGFSREAISEIKECFAAIFAGGDPRKLAAVRSAMPVRTAEARRFLEFFAGGKRGFIRPNPRASTDGSHDEA